MDGTRPVRSIALQIAAVALSLAAAYVSFNLLVKHLQGSSGIAWFEAGCAPDKGANGTSGGGGADCDAVLATPWSYVPPKFEGDPPDKYAVQVPAAFLGLVYYSVLTVWFVAVGCPSRSRRWVLLPPMLAVLLGLGSSVFFTYIMFTNIDEWCPWCMVTHGLNVLIAICLVLTWPRKLLVASGYEHASVEEAARMPKDAATTAGPSPHPSNRLLLTTVIALGLVLFGQYEMLGMANTHKQAIAAQRSLGRCKVIVDRLTANTRKLVETWKSGVQHDILLRPDDPARTHGRPGEPTWEVVVFSDLACPPCRLAGKFLEEKAQPLFAGHLNITFKHYPLNAECNANLKTKMHKFACMGAAIVEAARIRGGNDGFWQAHDLLFASQREFNQGKLPPEEVAIQLGFDPAEFTETMRSPTVAKRVWEDVSSTADLPIRGTPTIFVNRRKVDGVALRDIDFWNSLADLYWQSAGQPRPESTTLSQQEPTPGSPDRKAAP